MTIPQKVPNPPVKTAKFSARCQAEFADEWMARRIAETEPQVAHKVGRPTYWSDVKRLLNKHTVLTTGDISTLTGRNESAVYEFMRTQIKRGRVKSHMLPESGRIVAWRLVG